ncbi:probable mediator of RNA polymerase ii transcription subunit 26b [Phtheirospermum japonicum]|uniref:Probable mediator of RNA polymerase ii transcription subunit 26b n=1 Tax=Phtheirospermum japonicum TaxID=374723 RepID=A0A830B801_9LAMI|nr:probable mediator of RNA polymerase ii transcription subunit 26b [Phtheirospermum japonicum]
MANTSIGLDKWRDYFRTANSDIFSIIEHAIMVAASDCPYDFKLKRDRIAETLFNCKITKCFGCDRIELSVPKIDGAEKIGNDDDDKYKSGIIENGGSKDTKESKVNSSRDDYNDDGDDHHRDIMEMHMNNNNNHHVRDDCYGDAEALTDEIEEEKWRPEKRDIIIPKRNCEIRDHPNAPLNDDMRGENKRNQEPMLRKQVPPCKPNRPVKDERGSVRPKPLNCENGTTRPKPVSQLKAKNEIMVQQKSDKGTIQKKPIPLQREKLNGNNEALVRTKLEAAKRKLQERYQEAENAKKQRTIQVVELHDLPKQGFIQRNQQTRPSGTHQHRQWANGRR